MDPLYSISKVMEVARDPNPETKTNNYVSVPNSNLNSPENKNNINTFEWENLLEKKKSLFKEKQDAKKVQSWREASTIRRSQKSSQSHNRPISRSQTSKSSLSVLLKNVAAYDNQLTTKVPSTQSVAAIENHKTRTQSDSFASNEAFYLNETKKLSGSERDFMKSKKKHISSSASQSVLEVANNWSGTLRQDYNAQSELKTYKSSKRMLFDTNNNTRTSKVQLRRIRKKKTNIKPLPLEERQWLKVQSNHWRQRRGYVSSTTAPVGRDDFHRLFTAFQIASNNKTRNSEAFITDKDIKNLALRLGVSCSDRDARKMADIFDEDGSRHVTFPEMINVMKKARSNHSEPLLGSGITLQQLLIANKRRYMLDNILKQHKRHNALNNNMVGRKQSFANSFGANRPTSSASVLSVEAKRIRMKDMQVNIENIESEEYLRQRQMFDGNTRKEFICLHCSKSFEYSHIFEAHMLERHQYKGKFFTCYQCSEKWIPMADRGSHMMKHKTGKNNHKNKQYESQQSKHGERSHSQSVLDRFKCQYCKLVFPSRGVLAHHHSQEHRPLSLDIFRCTYCDDSFDTYAKVLKHKKEFHSNKLTGTKHGNSRSGVGQEFMDAIAQLDDYDSDNDMSPEEFQEKSQMFYKSESRRMLKQRVSHLGHLLNFRATYNMPDRTVDKLKAMFDQQDQVQRTRALQHVTSLLTSKFTEVVTEDETQTFTETITEDE